MEAAQLLRAGVTRHLLQTPSEQGAGTGTEAVGATAPSEDGGMAPPAQPPLANFKQQIQLRLFW